MDELSAETSHLKKVLREMNNDKDKKQIVENHIQTAEKLFGLEVNCVVDDFPSGLDWFNTTQPLSKKLLQGKIVVLDFFTYCCINCLHIIPHLRQLEKKFLVTDGLVVVGIHSAKFENERDSKNIFQALKKYNISHPVINDYNCFMWDKLSISCWPTIIILGPQWQPLFSLVGEDYKDELFLFVKVALEFYKSSISTKALPLLSNDQILTSSFLSFPGKIDKCGNLFAVSDSGNHRVVIFDGDGYVKHKIGGKSSGFKDGSFETARFNFPQGVAFYDLNTIYVADTENHAIRMIDLLKCSVTTAVGTGHQGTDYTGGKPGAEQEISSPWDVCIIPCSDVNLRLQHASTDFQKGFTSSFLPSPGSSSKPFPPPPPPPPPFFSSKPFPPPPPPPPPFSSSGPTPPTLVNAASPFSSGDFFPPDVTSNHSSSKVLLIAAAGTHQIWALFIDGGMWWKGKKFEKNICVAIAGNGKEENRNNHYPMMASFAQPSGLSYSKELKCVFIADSESSSIRKLSLKDGSVSHVVGGTRSPNDLFGFGDKDGKGYDVKLQHPLGVTYSSKQNLLFICDTYNHKIKVVNVSSAVCKSLHEKGDMFNEPSACCLNDSEDVLYVCDTNNNCIKLYSLTDGSLKKLDLKETTNEIDASPKNIWKAETTLDKKGGILNLKVIFSPEEIHGKWRLDVDQSKINTDSMKGKITSNAVEFSFHIAPSELDDVLQIFFDLVLCGDQICEFEKVLLELLIRKREDAKKVVMCELKKNLR